jgi:hypothetical protein
MLISSTGYICPGVPSGDDCHWYDPLTRCSILGDNVKLIDGHTVAAVDNVLPGAGVPEHAPVE